MTSRGHVTTLDTSPALAPAIAESRACACICELRPACEVMPYRSYCTAIEVPLCK